MWLCNFLHANDLCESLATFQTNISRMSAFAGKAGIWNRDDPVQKW